MSTTGKLIYRFGHIWSISASLGLWFLLFYAVPDNLLQRTHALIDKGLTGATRVQMVSSRPSSASAVAASCIDHPQHFVRPVCSADAL